MPRSIDNVVARNSGSYGSPTWDTVAAISDCKLSDSKGEFDITTRAELGAEVFAATTVKYEYSGKFRVPKHGLTDADYNAFAAAYYANTPIELAIVDGPVDTSGVEGVRAYFQVMTWNQSEGNGDINFRDFSLKPTISTTASEKALRRVKVTGGGFTYAEINSGTFA